MKYNPEIHNRQSTRLKGYDYSQDGMYFVTICTKNNENFFGYIENGKMVLNDVGMIIKYELLKLERNNSIVMLDEYTIMPNHIHCIIGLNVGAWHLKQSINSLTRNSVSNAIARTRKFGKPLSNTLSSIINNFKSICTRHVNSLKNTPGDKIWQRNYYDHIIRNDEDLNRVREYIINNTLKLDIDKENKKIKV